MKKPTKMRFETIKDRDNQLKQFKTIQYTIDKKDPLVIWVQI